jgi:hypothetical protein
VPQDQSQLRNLLSLLAQLQESSLTGSRLHKLGYPLEDAPVLLGHANISGLDVVRRSARHDVVARHGRAVVGRKLLVVSLLGSLLGSLSLDVRCLRLCLRLRLELTVLGYMVLRLLMMALPPLARVLLLMGEEMLHLLRCRRVRVDGEMVVFLVEMVCALLCGGRRSLEECASRVVVSGEESGVGESVLATLERLRSRSTPLPWRLRELELSHGDRRPIRIR